MDTLIDNRNFPPEMQEQVEKKEPKKTSWLPILLILIGISIIIFLIYTLFIKKPEPLEEPVPLTKEELTTNLKEIHINTPVITLEERNRKVDVFFN